MAEQAEFFLKTQKALSDRLLSVAIALGSTGGLLVIAHAWCLAYIVNAVIFDDQLLSDVMVWIWVGLLILLLRITVTYATERVAFLATANIKQKLREDIVEKLQLLGPLYLSGERSGEISTLLIDGIEALESYYARYLPAMSLAMWIPLAILVFVFPLDWQSGLVFLITAPLIPFFMILIGKGAERLNQHQWKQLSRLGGHFLDVIQGLTTLKIFNASQREAGMIKQMSEGYRHATMRVLRVAFLSSLALEFFATVSVAVVAVLIGFRLLFGEMDFQVGFLVLLLAPEFYLPLRILGTHYHGRMDAIAVSERIVEILQSSTAVIENRSIELFDNKMAIEFKQVKFAYADRPALNGIDFSIPAGKHVALVGPSGSGKTTLVNLLLGFIQVDEGLIRINGHNLDQVKLDSWRQQIAWVPQRPRLFYGSVLDNVTLGQSSFDQQSVLEALEQSCAVEFVEKLPHGLDTIVGEGGHGLSGGQIQRLALARAFMRKARLLILDEPTAHLDNHSESLVQQAIQRFAQGRTLLTIAHRLETVKQVDQIIVLRQGQVIQQGQHDHLITQTGIYRELVYANGLV